TQYTHTHNTQNTHQYIKTQMHLPRTNSKYMLFICTSPDTWHFTLISLDTHTHTHTHTLRQTFATHTYQKKHSSTHGGQTRNSIHTTWKYISKKHPEREKTKHHD